MCVYVCIYVISMIIFVYMCDLLKGIPIYHIVCLRLRRSGKVSDLLGLELRMMESHYIKDKIFLVMW